MNKNDGVIRAKYVGVDGKAEGDLILNKIYDVLSVEDGWYRIVDESGDDYIYPPMIFVKA